MTKDYFAPDWAVHPGEILAEVLEERHLSQKVAAKAIGISEQYMNDIIQGRRGISMQVAMRLENLGITRSFWLSLQATYDRRAIKPKVVSHSGD